MSATEIESGKQEEERVRKENVRLEERTRIAQELHDTLLQSFQSASLHLGAALYGVAQDSAVKPQLDRILQIMKQGIEEGRNAIQGLRSVDVPPFRSGLWRYPVFSKNLRLSHNSTFNLMSRPAAAAAAFHSE